MAEYLAFDLNKNVLVILTDMTSYCEALREFSSSKGEIPAARGFPGYLYSDLASLYERAGIIKGSKGLCDPDPDPDHAQRRYYPPHPRPDGLHHRGQIVLDRGMDATGLYPPVSVLPSLSRLMKDGIGAGYTREDHVTLSNQLFACYAKVQDAKALASVIGEEELSQSDKQLMAFGRAFEQEFIGQGQHRPHRWSRPRPRLGAAGDPCPATPWTAATPRRWISITNRRRRESVKIIPKPSPHGGEGAPQGRMRESAPRLPVNGGDGILGPSSVTLVTASPAGEAKAV